MVLPAHAGVILIYSGLRIDEYCPSRTRGGDPLIENDTNAVKVSFPHTRG